MKTEEIKIEVNENAKRIEEIANELEAMGKGIMEKMTTAKTKREEMAIMTNWKRLKDVVRELKRMLVTKAM